MDYWGLSYRQGLEYIANHDTSGEIVISAANMPGRLNLQMLPAQTRQRFRYSENVELADYFLDNFRWRKAEVPNAREIFTTSVENSKVLSVYVIPHSENTVIKDFYTDFETTKAEWLDHTIVRPEKGAYSGDNVNLMDSIHDFSAAFQIAIDSSLIIADDILVRASFFLMHFLPTTEALFVVSINSSDFKESIFWVGKQLNKDFVHYTNPGNWIEREYVIKLPQKLSVGNKLSMYIWNIDKKKIFLDNFKVELISVCP